jgi:hypothetical protein
VAPRQGQNVVEYGILIATIGLVVLLGVDRVWRANRTWFAAPAGRIITIGT